MDRGYLDSELFFQWNGNCLRFEATTIGATSRDRREIALFFLVICFAAAC